MNISLKQLNVFVTITRQQSLTAAAKLLYLSKAAVSSALSELEHQLGYTLFDRINNRLVLNQQGKKLLPLADELINRAEELSGLANANQLSGTLRIGASDTIGNQVIPSLLSRFRQDTQHLEQQVHISNSEQICKMLCEFNLDIGIIETDCHHRELEALSIGEDRMCVICPNDHPLANGAEQELAKLESSHWVLREPGSGSREYFVNQLSPNIEHWQLSLELNTTEAIINSVAAGLGLGCLSELSAKEALCSGKVSLIKLHQLMPRNFYLLVHQDKFHTPLISAFIKQCRRTLLGINC